MIQYNRIFLRVPGSRRDLAAGIPGSKFHVNIQEYSWPVTMIESIRQAFPELTAQLQAEYDQYMSTYAKQQKALAAARQQHRDNGARSSGGKKYIKELRQDLSVLGKLPGEKDLLDEARDKPDPLDNFKLKPFEHQMQMLKVGLAREKLAYFCEMGTGKTKVMIDLIRFRLEEGQRVLILCPKSVMSSWANEFDKNSNLPYNICTGTRKKKLQLLTDPKAVCFVTNYETVLSFGTEPGLWGLYHMVILDESSKIKSHKAQRTKIILSAFRNHKLKYILSGTPITSNVTDIWTQMNFLDPNILYSKSWYAFRNTYCIMGGFENYQVVGYRGLDKLKKLISRASVQLKKEECNLDPPLPDKVYQVKHIDMSTEMAYQYKQMLKESVLELSKEEDLKADIVLTKMLRLQQILSGQFLTTGRNEKLEELMGIIDDVIGWNKQIVVWAVFRPSIEIICNRLKEKGILYSEFHGDIKNRGEMIDDFQSGKNKVFVGQEATGGLGITLHTGSYMVYYENNFKLEDRKQSEDRIHRIGQRLLCTYIDLCYNGTMDLKILKAIQAKQDIAVYLVDSFKEGLYANRNKR